MLSDNANGKTDNQIKITIKAANRKWALRIPFLIKLLAMIPAPRLPPITNITLNKAKYLPPTVLGIS